jgi:anti-sigma B factor antagonist
VSHFHIGEHEPIADATRGRAVVVLTVSGEIDYAASPYLRRRILEHTEAGGAHLIVDLSAVTFIDSMAIGVLIGAVTRLRETDRSLTVACSAQNERVLRIFDIAGVASMIPLHRSSEEALAVLACGRPDEMRESVDPTSAITFADQPGQPAPVPLSGPVAARRYAADATTTIHSESGSPGPGNPGGAVDEQA